MKKKKIVKATSLPPVPPNEKYSYLPWIVVGLFAAYLVTFFRVVPVDSQFNVEAFGHLPVLNGGRLKPLDSVARSALLVLSGKQALRVEGQSKSATEWLVDMLYQPERANTYKIFQIDDPDVLGLMGIEQTTKRRFSFQELHVHLAEIETQAAKASEVKSEQRSRFQRSMAALGSQMTLYQKLQNTLQISGDDHVMDGLAHFEKILLPILESHMKSPAGTSESLKMLATHLGQYQFIDQIAEFYPVPSRVQTEGVNGWVSMGRGVMDRRAASGFHPAVLSYSAMGDAFRALDPQTFNKALAQYREWLHEWLPNVTSSVDHEVLFNRVQPFYQSMIMYTVVFLLTVVSWLVWPKTLSRTAFWLLIFSFLVHTIGLVARMVLQGRPPVTNLYSSAVFVGWVAVLLGIVLEKIFRKGVGSAVASAIGFITLIIAHHLAVQGDTLEMMRAVLDSNFWLATHVVCITIGYSSTFLSGFLALLYILRRQFDPTWSDEAARTLERMVYGVVCFSLFFSFIGTILGGIWADQSWGRFWGWDPKENGALMIVLWNACILHARWGGFAKQRGIMAMAIIGNVVTALSWFGVNMLGIGLHSYGFMDKAFVWLMVFALSQLVFVVLLYLPVFSRRIDR